MNRIDSNARYENNFLPKWLELFPKLAEIRDVVYEAYPDSLPAKVDCLNAFYFTDPDAINVVILGQDPYHTPGKAYGLAFGYHHAYGGPVDSSLANILTEVEHSYPGYELRSRDHRSLASWAAQGVLLLNTSLTVMPHEPMSHVSVGWETVIPDVLRYVNAIGDRKIVWALLGIQAQEYMNELYNPESNQPVLYTSHPSNMSHDRGFNPFTGSFLFRKINNLLPEDQQIEWGYKKEELE